jgi:hypothetical protein
VPYRFRRGASACAINERILLALGAPQERHELAERLADLGDLPFARRKKSIALFTSVPSWGVTANRR